MPWTGEDHPAPVSNSTPKCVSQGACTHPLKGDPALLGAAAFRRRWAMVDASKPPRLCRHCESGLSKDCDPARSASLDLARDSDPLHLTFGVAGGGCGVDMAGHFVAAQRPEDKGSYVLGDRRGVARRVVHCDRGHKLWAAWNGDQPVWFSAAESAPHPGRRGFPWATSSPANEPGAGDFCVHEVQRSSPLSGSH